MNETPIELETIQQQVQKNGAYSPFHWLLEAGYLPYSHYEDWRYGRRRTLDGAFTLNDDELDQLLSDSAKLSLALKLSDRVQKFYSWNAESSLQELLPSHHQSLSDHLSKQWFRSDDIPQMDLFMDNGAAETENQLIEAVAQRRWSEAEALYNQLCEQAASNARLSQFETLIIYGKYVAHANDMSADEAKEELAALNTEIAPVAKELLRHLASDYLAAAWQRLSRYLPCDSFDPLSPDFHTSYALAQLPDWPKVIDAVLATPGFSEHEVLIARLAEAFWHQQQEVALLLWCYMASLPKGEDFLDQVKQQRFKRTWNHYWELDLPPVLFSAWFLLQEPGIIHHVDSLPVVFESNLPFETMKQLLEKEATGTTDVKLRKDLQSVSPELLQCYLQRRA